MKLPTMFRIGKFKVFPSRTWYTQHTHGPKTWPWWRLVSVVAVKVSVNCSPSPLRLNHNMWFYTRWGAWTCQVVYDTRRFA